MTEPIKWSAAPDRTSWGHGMMVADVEIDKDHTLTLYCEADQVEKVNALFADAERYRWLRDMNHWPACFGSHSAPEPVRGSDLDAAIDAALKEPK
jgi:hypothetical protein